jgi:hypothetical protein
MSLQYQSAKGWFHDFIHATADDGLLLVDEPERKLNSGGLSG